jgi:O-antigen/teichoic acid export membrane protein
MIQKIKKEIHLKFTSKVFLNFFWISSGQILSVFLLVFINIFLSRYLDPIDYGRVQLAQAMIFFVSFADSFVFPAVARKLYIEKPDENVEILKAHSSIITRAYFCILVLFLFCYFFFKEYISDPIPYQILLCQLVFLPFNRYFSYSELLNSSLMSRINTVYANITNIVMIVLIVLCVLLKMPLFFLGFAFGFKSLLLWFFYKRYFRQLDRSNINQGNIEKYKKKLFRESRVYFFNEILKRMTSRSDRLILGFFYGPEIVAFYVAGIKLTEPWSMFVSSISLSKYPSLVKSAEMGNKFLYENYIKYLRVINLFSFSLAFTGFFFAKKIIFIVYGSLYEPSVIVFKLNLLVLPFLFWWVTEPNLTVLLGIGKKIFYKNTLAAILSICLNFFLIPKMGMNGSLYANLVTYAFLGCLGNLIFKETRILFKLQMQSLLVFNVLSKKPQVIDK